MKLEENTSDLRSDTLIYKAIFFNFVRLNSIFKLYALEPLDIVPPKLNQIERN